LKHIKILFRIIGNAGIMFVTPYAGSAAALGMPNLEIALWSMGLGLIASTSRELIEYGKERV